jgi:hypothetical protein
VELGCSFTRKNDWASTTLTSPVHAIGSVVLSASPPIQLYAHRVNTGTRCHSEPSSPLGACVSCQHEAHRHGRSGQLDRSPIAQYRCVPLHGGFGADTSVRKREEEAPPPFRFVSPVREYSCVGLGTSDREKRDERAYMVPFRASWPGSERSASMRRLKHSWSRTLLARHAGERRGTCQLPPMHREVSPKQRAGFGTALVAAESRCKPPTSRRR